MDNANFKQLCNSFRQTACVVSVEKKGDGYGEIRIVDGNDAYANSFKGEGYVKHEFVPNSIYTDYLEKNLNFEEYCFRSAIKKELLHSYAYPEHFQIWMHMLFIPISVETDNLAYCLYIMEMNEVFNPELLANPNGNMYSNVLNTTLQLSNTADFKQSMKNVAREIRKNCKAQFCCVLLVDEEKKDLTVLAEDRDLNSGKKEMKYYMGDNFYEIVKTWDDLIIRNGNCIIIDDEKKMEYIKEKAPIWYESLKASNIKSLVLFKLKSGKDPLGYMWVSDFTVEDTPSIKEALEITTFILGSQIANYLLLKKLTELSSIDFLTGLHNRNRLNSFMNEIIDSPNENIALIFLDINGLKKVNDIDGHLAGDSLIRRAANTLIGVFPENEIFRVGGDEFVTILRGVKEQEVINYIKLLKQRAKKNDVSFAIGYAMTDKADDMERILREADANMYEDKRKFYRKN